jgi:carbamoyltransferase
VISYLEDNAYPFHKLEKDSRSQTIAQQIADGKIVGYMAGRMEFGPRALGARSILGDPRRKDTQTVMNLKIKYRESFRPFAPTVLEEKSAQYFDLDRPSPYMLLVADVKDRRRLPQPSKDSLSMMERLNVKRSDIPAVTHLDYSARLQTVNAKDKPDYYEVISEFEKLTGCAVVVNTSFNVRGEPIICTPQDAYRCFMRTEMDVLVLENCLLYKGEQPPWKESDTWRDELELD